MFTGDPYAWPSRRSPVLATSGMVASSQPLASEAGLRILRAGGNAADAAVAMAAALAVRSPSHFVVIAKSIQITSPAPTHRRGRVSPLLPRIHPHGAQHSGQPIPSMSSPFALMSFPPTPPPAIRTGGDAFLLFYRASTRTVHSIQGNGRCPAELSLPHLATLGFSPAHPLPPFHPLTVTVPGAAACWVDAIQRFGSRHVSLREALEPAVQLAEGGWPVPPLTAGQWERGVEQLKQGGTHGGELLVEGERAPRAGEVMRNPGMGNTLRLLGEKGRDGFCTGQRLSIATAVQAQGRVLSLHDLILDTSLLSLSLFPPPEIGKEGFYTGPVAEAIAQQCMPRAGCTLCTTSCFMHRCCPSVPSLPLTTEKGKEGFYTGPVAEAIVTSVQADGDTCTLHSQPNHASSLSPPPHLTPFPQPEHGRDGFYTGPVAEAIVTAVQSQGGVLSLQDLASHTSSFAPPICTTFHGLTIWEVPPPTHGLAALIALNITEAYYSTHGLPEPAREARGAGPEPAGEAREEGWVKGEADYAHVMIEAMRMGFADALACVADPEHVQVPLGKVLSKEYAAKRAGEIDLNRAAIVEPGIGAWGGVGTDTVYFCAMDGEGNACSMINSNYMGFGTGIVPQGCGFPLQNRGHNFSLDPSHPNCLAPGKRPYHTIIPGLATWGDTPATAAAAAGATAAASAGAGAAEESRADEGVPAGDMHCTFGVMGGFMQPQGHLQVVTSLALLSLNPQAALDRPRFCLSGLPSLSPPGHGPGPVRESHVAVEEGLGREEVAEELRRRGHRVEVVRGEAREVFGKGQVIVRERGSGVLWGGSEGRADGCAMGF
ncbi:unnamed protein product [Closterium sp. NIES-53]